MLQAFGAISTWTIFLANSLYVEAKRRKVRLELLSRCIFFLAYISLALEHTDTFSLASLQFGRSDACVCATVIYV